MGYSQAPAAGTVEVNTATLLPQKSHRLPHLWAPGTLTESQSSSSPTLCPFPRQWGRNWKLVTWKHSKPMETKLVSERLPMKLQKPQPASSLPPTLDAPTLPLCAPSHKIEASLKILTRARINAPQHWKLRAPQRRCPPTTSSLESDWFFHCRCSINNCIANSFIQQAFNGCLQYSRCCG